MISSLVGCVLAAMFTVAAAESVNEGRFGWRYDPMPLITTGLHFGGAVMFIVFAVVILVAMAY
jgi:uncharacterized membrane protein